MRYILLSGIIVLSTGCKAFENLTGGDKTDAVGAIAELQDANGSFVGVAFISEDAGGARIALRLRGLEPGEYAVHVHEFAAAPGDFESAGGHFNPFGREHGLLNPKGPHAGDLPNIVVGENGSFEGSISAPLVTLGDGKHSLFKSGGTSLVIHKGPDDGRSQPSGQAGDRVACGPIRKADAASYDSYRKAKS
jgi:Cu-Zn family superoxide dismutase